MGIRPGTSEAMYKDNNKIMKRLVANNGHLCQCGKCAVVLLTSFMSRYGNRILL